MPNRDLDDTHDPNLTSPTLTFGQWLKRRRRRMDLTQQELGQRAGCSGATVKKIESDDLKPSKQLAELMATALGVPAEHHGAFVQFARQGTLPASWAQSDTAMATKHDFDFGTPTTKMPTAPYPVGPITPVWFQMPAPLTDLIGRQRELETARKLLQQRAVRLITLAGPPGTGKTHLATEIARQMQAEFEHGACVVWLSGLSDATLVPTAIGQALGLDVRDHAEAVVALRVFLKDKHLLLLLDNFEHVLFAAPLVIDLLHSAPQLKVLVTSRESLSVTGEYEFPVPPLDVPDVNHLPALDALAVSPSVALFIARAQAVRPDFKLSPDNASDVARICGWLEGLPLAIEMAAARVKWANPKDLLGQISSRLSSLAHYRRDLSQRHQTMWAAVDWSYMLLSDAERILLRRLATFPNGAFIPGIEAVCQDQDALILGVPVAELLAQLVNKSLVIAGELQSHTLYRLLEPVRQYAWDKLVEAAELREMKRRLILRVLDQNETSARQLFGPDHSEVAQLMDLRMHTVRAAMEWAFELNDVPTLIRLIVATAPHWITLGYFEEAWRTITQALPMLETLGDVGLRASLLRYSAEVAFYRNDHAQSRLLAERAIHLSRNGNDPRTLAGALWVDGITAYWQNDSHKAQAQFEACIAISRANQLLDVLALSLSSLGDLMARLERYPDAERIFQECVSLATRAGDDRNKAIGLRGLADSLSLQHRLAEAEPVYEASLTSARKIGDRITIAISLVHLAILASLADEHMLVQGYAQEALDIFKYINAQHEIPFLHRLLGYAALGLRLLDEAEAWFRSSLSGNIALGSHGGILAGVLSFAALALAREEWAQAARLYSIVAAQLPNEAATIIVPAILLETDMQSFQRIQIALQAMLDTPLANPETSGSLLSLDEAAAEVMASRN